MFGLSWFLAFGFVGSGLTGLIFIGFKYYFLIFGLSSSWFFLSFGTFLTLFIETFGSNSFFTFRFPVFLLFITAVTVWFTDLFTMFLILDFLIFSIFSHLIYSLIKISTISILKIWVSAWYSNFLKSPHFHVRPSWFHHVTRWPAQSFMFSCFTLDFSFVKI